MFTQALRGAFGPVSMLTSHLGEWWQEKTFWPYYYSFSSDPRDLLNILPLSRPTIDQISRTVDNSRSAFLASQAAQSAAGLFDARPGQGTLFSRAAKFSLEILARTGISTPLAVALLSGALLFLFDYTHGHVIRDTVTNLISSLNSESGKINNHPAEAPEAGVKPKLFAQPSFS